MLRLQLAIAQASKEKVIFTLFNIDLLEKTNIPKPILMITVNKIVK